MHSGITYWVWNITMAILGVILGVVYVILNLPYRYNLRSNTWGWDAQSYPKIDLGCDLIVIIVCFRPGHVVTTM